MTRLATNNPVARAIAEDVAEAVTGREASRAAVAEERPAGGGGTPGHRSEQSREEYRHPQPQPQPHPRRLPPLPLPSPRQRREAGRAHDPRRGGPRLPRYVGRPTRRMLRTDATHADCSSSIHRGPKYRYRHRRRPSTIPEERPESLQLALEHAAEHLAEEAVGSAMGPIQSKGSSTGARVDEPSRGDTEGRRRPRRSRTED